VTKDYVRMELQGANLIQPRPEGGILYTYIQHVRLAGRVVSCRVFACVVRVCAVVRVLWFGADLSLAYGPQLDSKVPTLVANKPLGGVMLKETEARRKALSNPIVGSQ
jgi:hypothetical protein